MCLNFRLKPEKNSASPYRILNYNGFLFNRLRSVRRQPPSACNLSRARSIFYNLIIYSQPSGAIAAAAAPGGATAYAIPRVIQSTQATAQLQGGITYTAAGAVAAPQQITYAAGTPLLDPYQQAALTPNAYGVSSMAR